MVAIKTVFPLFQVGSPADAAAFYTKNFGFEPIFEADWYVQIRSGSQELAFITASHESIPSDRRGLSRNTCLTIEVEDVDALHEQVKASMQVIVEPRTEPWGQRHFLGYDPAGLLLDVMKMVPAQ